MESVPPSIYFKIHRRTAHENFKYLAKCFRNSKPIPRANEFQHAGTAAAAETPEKSPTSTNAATEQHANTKPDEDLSNSTKALTRGTEDVDDENVGHIQDPRTSIEASAKGTSTKRAETTLVVLESTLPHKTQDRPQNSLQATPLRLPTEGKPCACKQGAEDRVVTAECTNGTVEMAEPTKIADVDLEKAALGGDLVERACGVDKGDGTERKGKGEIIQCSGNMENNVPITDGLPLEGEWSVYLSDKSDTLIPVSIESESLGSGGIPCVCLGGTRMWPGNVNGPGCRVDESDSQMEGSRAQTDTLNASNEPEMAVVSHSEGAGMYQVLGT